MLEIEIYDEWLELKNLTMEPMNSHVEKLINLDSITGRKTSIQSC